MHAVLHARANRVRVGGAVAQQRGGEGARDRRLARAAGAVEEVGVAGPAVGRQRAAEDGAGVGVTLGGGEHLWKATAMRGQLITIEGLDGSGKTTLADALVDALRARGTRRGAPARARRASSSPSASARWSRTRRWPSTRAPRRCSTPRRARSSWPSASSRRWRRGRGCCSIASSTPRWPTRASGAGWGSRRCATINHFATGGLRPDRTLLLRADAATRAARQAVRGEAPDRLEREDDAFFDAIAGAYDALAAAEPERFRVLDAGAEPRGACSRAARAALADLAASIGGRARTQGSHRPHVRGRARHAGRGARQRLRRHAEGVPDDRCGQRLQVHRRRSSRRPRRRRRRTSRTIAPGYPGAARRRRPRSARRAAPRPRRRPRTRRRPRRARRPARPRPARPPRHDRHGARRRSRPRRRRVAPNATTTAATPATAPAPAPAAAGDQRRRAVDRLAQGRAPAPSSSSARCWSMLLALWAFARWWAWEPHWLARWRHATAEAGWRASAAWAEFTDWLRLGR